MSILTMCLSSSNSSSASVFATSVFPTPVGPRNINEPIAAALAYGLGTSSTLSESISASITKIDNIVYFYKKNLWTI